MCIPIKWQDGRPRICAHAFKNTHTHTHTAERRLWLRERLSQIFYAISICVLCLCLYATDVKPVRTALIQAQVPSAPYNVYDVYVSVLYAAKMTYTRLLLCANATDIIINWICVDIAHNSIARPRSIEWDPSSADSIRVWQSHKRCHQYIDNRDTPIYASCENHSYMASCMSVCRVTCAGALVCMPTNVCIKIHFYTHV